MLPATVQSTPEAFAILHVDGLLDRLSAEKRAQIAWARPSIKDALRRLRSEPLTDDVLRTAAAGVWSALVALARAFWEAVAADRESVLAAIKTDLERDRETLQRFVADEDASETIDWLFRWFGAYFGMLRFIPPGSFETIPPESLEVAPQDDDFMRFFAGQLCLLAAIDAAREGDSVDRARDLIDLAFLHLTRADVALRRSFVFIDPFAGETLDERRERAIRYARRASDALDDNDARIFDDARLRRLR